MADTQNPDRSIDSQAPVAPISGEAEKPSPSDPTLEPETPGLLSDCRLMLSYARKNAFVLPPTLLREIAWLDSYLKSKGISPISAITSRLISPIDTTKGEPRYVPDGAQPVTAPASGNSATVASPAHSPAPPAGLSVEEVILDVHGELSTQISPTTALSLQTSEPPAGKVHVLGGMPPLVRTVIGVAILSAGVFVATALGIARDAAKARAPESASEVPNATGQGAVKPPIVARPAASPTSGAPSRPDVPPPGAKQ